MLEILLPVAQVSHQKVQVGIVWRQLVSGVQPSLSLFKISRLQRRDRMLSFLASLGRQRFVNIQLKGRGISLQHDLQFDAVQSAYHLQFFVVSNVSYRAHFNIVMSERQVAERCFRPIVCSLPTNGLCRLISKFDNRLPVQTPLIVFGVYRKQKNGSATPAVEAGSQIGRGSRGFERSALRRGIRRQE